MNILLLILVVSVFTALICLSLGSLIAVKKKFELINGVDFSTLKEPEKFGKFVGHSISVSGILMALLGFLAYAQIIGITAFLILIVIVSVIPLPAFYLAKSKYSGQESAEHRG